MFEVIYNAEATAAFRRCHFSLRNTTDDTPFIGAIPAGTKARLALSGTGPGANSTNDIVQVDATNFPGAHYIECTLAELTAFVKGEVIGSVHGLAGAKTEDFQFSVVPYDPRSSTPPDVNLVSAVGHTLSGDGTTTPIHA